MNFCIRHTYTDYEHKYILMYSYVCEWMSECSIHPILGCDMRWNAMRCYECMYTCMHGNHSLARHAIPSSVYHKETTRNMYRISTPMYASDREQRTCATGTVVFEIHKQTRAIYSITLWYSTEVMKYMAAIFSHLCSEYFVFGREGDFVFWVPLLLIQSMVYTEDIYYFLLIGE